jgi:hypothetical protein
MEIIKQFIFETSEVKNLDKNLQDCGLDFFQKGFNHFLCLHFTMVCDLS